MSLGAPWMLLLLPLVAGVAWLAARARRLQRAAACRLQGVAPPNGPGRLNRRDGLALAALALVIVALARPRWNPRPYEVERKGRDLVIALDISRSMLATDVLPSRLEAARMAIHEALPAWAGQRIALVTFAGSANVRVPLTLDHGFVRYMLERADPSDVDLGSTSLQAACQKAVDAVLTDAAGGRRDLIVITDGEDHLSDLDQTAELLAHCGARVLIVGLGDPVQGGRIPAAPGAKGWQRYQDADVVSRLDEGTLARLAGKSANVTYYPARTRPLDLVMLYEKLVAGADGDVVVGALRQVRYSEGYAPLLVLAAALWLASSPWKWPRARQLLLVLLLLPGCGRTAADGAAAAFAARIQRGDELFQHAQEQAGIDLVAARSLLVDAREALLRAALLRPGDSQTARKITAATLRLQEFDAQIARQRAAEQRRGESVAKLIGRLEKLAQRQTRLAQQSAQALRRNLVPPKADLSQSGDRDNEMTDDVPAANANNLRLAKTAATEQQAVREGTVQVRDTVATHRDALRKILARAYGNPAQLPPTEFDPIADLLAAAVTAQEQALVGLEPKAVRWPQVNTAFHMATGRMEQALEALRNQLPPEKDQRDAQPPMNAGGFQEELDGPGADGDSKPSQPAAAGDFAAALALQSLPLPNYTSAEIIAEESANQQLRARQKAARAGARVEKNW